MSIVIANTEHILTREEAKKFLRTHVVIAKADIRKIKAWAKKNGMSDKLRKELLVMIYPLAKSRGDSWGDR